MLAVPSDLSLLDGCESRIASLGYEALGEFGIPGRRYFRQDNSTGERTHQIHAFRTGSPQITRHLQFRDYLIEHPAVARDYHVLKRRTPAMCPAEIINYTEAKAAFLRDIDSHAQAWTPRR